MMGKNGVSPFRLYGSDVAMLAKEGQGQGMGSPHSPQGALKLTDAFISLV